MKLWGQVSSPEDRIWGRKEKGPRILPPETPHFHGQIELGMPAEKREMVR